MVISEECDLSKNIVPPTNNSTYLHDVTYTRSFVDETISLRLLPYKSFEITGIEIDGGDINAHFLISVSIAKVQGLCNIKFMTIICL